MINNANIIIRNIEDLALTGIPEASKKAINAEARFFRAYAYNILATCFGAVPITKEPLSAPKTDFVRAPVPEGNSLVEEDLLYAATNLPNPGGLGSKNNAAGKPAGRAHKFMANQLLSEAYLRMEKNDLAEQQANVVINSGFFSLSTTRFGSRAGQPGDPFADIFIFGNQRRSQNNREVIWVMEMEHLLQLLAESLTFHRNAGYGRLLITR